MCDDRRVSIGKVVYTWIRLTFAGFWRIYLGLDGWNESITGDLNRNQLLLATLKFLLSRAWEKIVFLKKKRSNSGTNGDLTIENGDLKRGSHLLFHWPSEKKNGMALGGASHESCLWVSSLQWNKWINVYFSIYNSKYNPQTRFVGIVRGL
jgi:hypothetical protein